MKRHGWQKPVKPPREADRPPGLPPVRHQQSSVTTNAQPPERGLGAMADEKILRYFCACAAYPDDPGSVVCWRCEQPLVDIHDLSGMNGVLAQNLLLLCVRYRRALEAVVTDSKHPELASAEYLRGIADGALDGTRPDVVEGT